MFTQEFIDTKMVDGSFDENAMFDADECVASLDKDIDEGIQAEEELLKESTFDYLVVDAVLNIDE